MNQTSVVLKGDREIVIVRSFNAPARIVFDAWTRADLVKRWWAPRSRGVSVLSCDADIRPGGKYRYVLKRDTGQELAFSGTYTEVTPPTRLVYTQFFEPFPDPSTITVIFEEHDGRTRMVATERYPSKAARDGALASGMEKGMREALDQLEELMGLLGGR
jgi:uncharacterized protein YndB with AHSA1/START domain